MLELALTERRSHAALMGLATGEWGMAALRLIVVLQQCGICTTYYVFVATNLQVTLDPRP